MSKPMDVSVRLTVRVDVDAWNAEYGDEESATDVREAVRMMALDSLTAATNHLRPSAVLDVDRDDWQAIR